MRRAALLTAVIAVATFVVSVGAAAAGPGKHPGPPPDFGPNVIVFDPSMPTSQIQATVDAVAAQQVDNEMGSQRYALLFKPGTYGSDANPLTFQVGYYTEVAGLGASPGDVTINGHVDVYNRCLAPDNCIALVNFWRSLSNLTINVMGLTGCRSSAEFWAVSQAAPMRRVNIAGGNLTLQDYCTAGPQYASGGFIADSQTGLRHQRIAAAVPRSGQQHRRLVERRLEPGLLGCPGRAAAVVLDDAVQPAAVHDARHQPGHA